MRDIIPEQDQWVRAASEQSPIKVVWRRICQNEFYGVFFSQQIQTEPDSVVIKEKRFRLSEIYELIEDDDVIQDLEMMLTVRETKLEEEENDCFE